MRELEELVRTSEKQRFELSPCREKIRARQGHSVRVVGDWPVAKPLDFLFHGTAPQFTAAIFREALRPGRRYHVHLSSTIEEAAAVGRRKGAPVVLEIEAGKMKHDGFIFRLSSNASGSAVPMLKEAQGVGCKVQVLLRKPGPASPQNSPPVETCCSSHSSCASSSMKPSRSFVGQKRCRLTRLVLDL